MYLEKLSLKGKTALVSGAGGGGIGTATSLALAEAGANLVAVDIIEDRVKDTKQRAEALGRRCLGMTADLRKKSEVDRVIAATLKEFGAIHCVANVAGGMQAHQWGGLLEYPEQAFDEVISLNLRYIFLVSQAAVKTMIERGINGSIVSVASVSGIASAPQHGPYGAAKSGLMALTRTMAVEWGPYGIRANCVAPGAVKTPRVLAMRGSTDMDATAKQNIPIGRACDPSDIAAAVLFLSSDLAGVITGQTVVVDGGATAKFMLTGRSPEQIEQAKRTEDRR